MGSGEWGVGSGEWRVESGEGVNCHLYNTNFVCCFYTYDPLLEASDNLILGVVARLVSSSLRAAVTIR